MSSSSSSSSSSLWPRLRRRVKKEGGGGKKNRRKENPYASTGLDRFAILVEELQAKRLAMVDKTAMSVSAVRSLSKSAQEWTASTLSTRTTATKRSSRITEQQLLLSKAPDAATRNEVFFQVAQKTEGEGSKQEGQQQQEEEEGRMIQQQECAHESSVVVAPREEADSGGVITSEIAAELVPPLKMMKRTTKTARRMGGRTGGSLGLRGSCVLLRDKAAASRAAVAVLVAVGAFFASKRAEWGKHVADAMSFSIVIRRWRNGKLYARFMFSAMASYVLTHLHSYLSVQRPSPPPPLPKRLTFFASSAALQKRVEEEEEQQQQQEKDQEAETSSMEQQEQQEISSFAMPILPAAAASSPPAAAAEIESSSNPPLPIISPTKTAKGSSSDKLSLKFKSRFVKPFHLSNVAPGGGSSSSPPMNSPGRLLATPPPSSSSSSSGDKHIVAPGCSSPSPSPSLEMENSDSNTVSSPSSSTKSEGVGRMGGDDAAAPTRRKGGGKKFCFSRKPKISSESLAIEETSRQKLSSYKRSKPPNGKNKSSIAAASDVDEVVAVEKSFTTMAADASSSGLRKIRTMRSVVGLPTVAEEWRETKMHSSSSSSLEGREESWLLCGLLLIALLFLLVDQVAAILATSFFLLVLSQLQKVRSSSSRGHQQQQGRDKDVTTMTPTTMTRALEASRKLHVSGTPGSPMSPSMMKIDINSKEYRKRVIMEGLLERKNLKGNG